MTAAFILGQNVNLAAELGVGMNGTGLRKHLAAFDLSSLNTAKQAADVVAGLSIVEDLAEHFDTGADGLSLFIGQTNDFNFFAGLELASFHSAGGR